MTDTLIWAGTVLIPVMFILACLIRPVRRMIETWISEHTATAAERDTAIQRELAGIGERRDALALSQATLGERTTAARARLAAEAARYDTDAEAARRAIDAAVAARRQALAARGQAEADLAPDLARTAASGQIDLAAAYAAYCRCCADINSTPWSFHHWIGDLDPSALTAR
jgi:hypothetical protein